MKCRKQGLYGGAMIVCIESQISLKLFGFGKRSRDWLLPLDKKC